MSTYAKFVIPMALIGLLPAVPAVADTFFFNTGNPDGRMAMASRPESAGGKFEIESADDFALGKDDLNHQRNLHRPAHGQRACRGGSGRDLPRLSQGFGCWANQRAADILRRRRSRPGNQFAL